MELLNPDTKIGKNAFPDGCIVKYGTEGNTGTAPELLVEEEEATSEAIENIDVVEINAADDTRHSIEPEFATPAEEADLEVQAESINEAPVDNQVKKEDSVEKPKRDGKLHFMKMLFCADVRLGAICTEKLDIKQSHKWLAARSEKLADLI